MKHPPGVVFSRVYSADLCEDGETFSLTLEMSDGSLRRVWWPIADLCQQAGEIYGAEHSPTGVALQ